MSPLLIVDVVANLVIGIVFLGLAIVTSRVLSREPSRLGIYLPVWVFGSLATGRFARLLLPEFEPWLQQSLNGFSAIVVVGASYEVFKHRAWIYLFKSPEHVAEETATQLTITDKIRKEKDALANMSHEIRTPVGIITGFVDVLMSESETSKRQRYVDIIHRNAEHLTRIIDDILDLSKIEANKLQFDVIQISFLDLLYEIEATWSVRAKEKGLEFKITRENALPEFVKTDPIRIKQILNNIICNGFKFTLQGHVCLDVSFDNSILTFDIRDSGIGLTDEQVGCLFQNFYQADTTHTRNFGGTGLGLALSRRLAKHLGGDVTFVEHREPTGCHFRFALRVECSAVQPHPEIHHARTHITSLKGVKILVAEDSPDNVALITHFLKAAGAEVEFAVDGLEAINKARLKLYDVILMDIQMPNVDGYEATRILRSEHYAGKIIAVTAHAMGEHRNRALAAGFDSYLVKPMNATNLTRTVREVFPAL